jgi:hypothetical protein
MLAIKLFDLDYPVVKNLVLNGFKSAFIPYKQRARLINETLKEFDRIEEEELKTRIKIKENL